MDKIKILILAILFFGIIFRLIISSGGNFYFNMDNGRDMVDVREMVVLKKFRLIGQTTAIDGFYYGPFWYYLLAIPFILSGGDPYASIIMEILLWAIGGYFLLLLVNRFYAKLALLGVGVLWIASNFILLATQYAFNPNPILFLTPVFVYLLIKFLDNKKLIYGLGAWFLAGAFFHFEITVGIFMPVIFILAMLLSKSTLFKTKQFWISLMAFFITFIPQLLFELRHQFFLTRSLLSYQSGAHGNIDTDVFARFMTMAKSFYNIILPTFMNFEIFTILSIILLFVSLMVAFKKKELLSNKLTLISILLVFVPFLGLIPLKVGMLPWYINASLVGAIILIGFIIHTLYRLALVGKILALILFILLFGYSIKNVHSYLQNFQQGTAINSHLKVELAVIDYIYKYANGKNFKVYTYLPSVYDYPYQYLFWWYGLKKYGFVPGEYAYLPSKPPQYVPSKERFEGEKDNFSGLVFLIKEPDQIGQRHLWENQFKDLDLISSEKLGPLIIEIRRESSLTISN